MKGGGATERLHRFAVAFGSNVGDRRANLEFGVRRVRQVAEEVVVSSIYMTRPRYVEDQPDFLNACCVGLTRLTPSQLLSHLKDSERAAGRRPGGVRYGPRVLDLDLLLYADRRIERPHLVVPHTGLRERAFVLVPLAEIAPAWVVPGTPRGAPEATVRFLAEAVGTEGVVRWNRSVDES
jgi:2-amino-4-hydroxy-6-hydroxymethyldihydropteridine diphosphokinase